MLPIHWSKSSLSSGVLSALELSRGDQVEFLRDDAEF